MRCRRTAERNRVWEMSRELLSAIVDFDGQFQAINPAWTATSVAMRKASYHNRPGMVFILTTRRQRRRWVRLYSRGEHR